MIASREINNRVELNQTPDMNKQININWLGETNTPI